ncbi:MAG: hypothetical protein JWM27_2933 [Gemmatimonadetes bacterium]|nr:hypothetical protein [Gemmatimonadota bacterium]
MASLRDFLAGNRHFTADAEVRRRAVAARIGNLLPNDIPPLWSLTLSVFVTERPRRYWDEKTVSAALTLLEGDIGRTVSALQHWRPQLNAGFDALFLDSAAALSEEGAGNFSVRGIVELGTVFHPEYLRFAEHVFGNLLTVYWAVQRKGSVNAKYDLPRAVGELNRNALSALVHGYNDRIRNAVAHGEIVYRGTDVQYGPAVANYQISPAQVLNTFDEIVRTSNALALAILLFWARNHDHLNQARVRLPVRLLGFIAASSADGYFVQFHGAYESETGLAGRQLHIGLHLKLANRAYVILMVGTIAYQLVEFGGVDYDRFLFEVDYGQSVSGLVVIQVEVLSRLLTENADHGRFAEMLAGTPLLWLDEGKYRTRVRVWKAIASTRYRIARADQRAELVRRGLVQDHGGYWVREFVSTGSGALLRARIQVVLKNPADAEDRGKLREIARLAAKDARRRWVTRTVGDFPSTSGWPAHPRQIEVRIFRVDGPVRWLGRDAWGGGNLVAVAESPPRINLRYKHVIVPQPDEVWRGLRLQYGLPKWIHSPEPIREDHAESGSASDE